MRDTLLALLMLGVAAATSAYSKERSCGVVAPLVFEEDKGEIDLKTLLQKALLR